MSTAIIDRLNAFFAKYPQQEFSKHHTLIDANQTPSGVFYIEEGIVRRYWIFANGTEITLNLYKPHAFLPMSWAIGNVPNEHIYEAMTDIVIRKAPKEAVLEFLNKEPAIVYDLLKRVYIGMEGLWQHIESLSSGNAQTKLVASLVILGKRFGKKENKTTVISLKMGEKELAHYAGMSRETVSRELQKLRKEQLIELHEGHIILPNLSLLEGILER